MRAAPLLLAAAAAASAASAASSAPPPPPPRTAGDDPSARARALLADMNLTEKLTLLHGVFSPGYTGATAAVPRLGIPALNLNDGRQGFRPNDGSTGQTAFPCQLATVASWDRSLWREFGQAMGDEFAGKGASVLLAPMLILARVINGGRNFESVGEDPELAYHYAFQHVTGAQSVPGVISNADDFVLNNQETDRTGVSAVCDERTLFELYYRGYQGAVDAGVGSIMCSYNLVNGTHACENAVTLGHLKHPRGLNFTGFVLSDWGGVHSTVASALAGLDQEMPGGDFFGPALAAAVTAGAVPLGVLDDKVLRVLTPMFAAGLFDAPPAPGATQDANVTSGAHDALARRLAAAGTVLLQNAGGLLPLGGGGAPVAALVVLGDAAHVDPYCCGRGSGGLSPPYVVDPLAGLAARAGPDCNVTYVRTPPFFANISTWFAPARGDSFFSSGCPECFGLYTQVRVEGLASAAACDGCVQLDLWYNGATSSNLVAAAGFAPPPGYALVRPQAWVLPLNYSGPAPTAVLELWRGATTPTGQPAGSHTDFWTLASAASRAEAQARGYTLVAALGRLPLQQPPTSALLPPPAAAALAAADAVVVVVSADSGEGSDRPSLALADADVAMITAAAAAAAPGRVVVVLNAPAAVLTAPWAARVAAVVMQFYPGQEMGHALADVLWGDVNPAGRLPVTFPVAAGDTPLQTPEQYPGINGSVVYSERLAIGYRWFDAAGVAPAFAFGHGLSYTSFAYSDLTLVDEGGAGGGVAVGFTLTNTGPRAGREVAQLYVGFPPSAGEPPLQLRDFASVPLAPGEALNVSLALDARGLSVWLPGPGGGEPGAWAVPPGVFLVAVGASSRDLRLHGSVTR